jgi:hypothetical protein
MLWMLVAMLLILVIAGAVVAYVAYPHRGEELPVAPWIGDAMKRGVEAFPVLPGELEGRRIPSQDLRRDLHPDQRQGQSTDA